MRIWIVSMECRGLAEAGGVKDTTYAMCKYLTRLGHEVTLFIPHFGCLSLAELTDVAFNKHHGEIFLCNRTHIVGFTTATHRRRHFNVVLLEHTAFKEKSGVYTYTKDEERLKTSHKAGTGHHDEHFLDCALCSSVAVYCKAAGVQSPDVLWAQDASCALTACYAEQQRPQFFLNTRIFVTIHNAGVGYHHAYYSYDEAKHNTCLPSECLHAGENYGRWEPFLMCAPFATLTTVSTFYADELLDPNNNELTDGLAGAFFARHIQIKGVTNGIDANIYNPQDPNLSLLPHTYGTNKSNIAGKRLDKEFLVNHCLAPCTNEEFSHTGLFRYGYLDEKSVDSVVFVFHGRLASQKGVPLILQTFAKLLQEVDARLVLISGGDAHIREQVIDFTQKNPGKVIFFDGYNEALVRLCIAGSDFALLPSTFEPCGLLDFIAQLYGTLPIAYATGGLQKILDGQTGFLFKEYSVAGLSRVVNKAISLRQETPQKFADMVEYAAEYVKQKYSWEHVISDGYMPLFSKTK